MSTLNSSRSCISIADYLSDNPYPGRGILIGAEGDGSRAVICYFIMGRSTNSKNRLLSETADGGLETVPFDPALVEDPSLIIYKAISDRGDCIIVSNGTQTDTIDRFAGEGKSFADALETMFYEPDEPHFTPRICGMLHIDGSDPSYELGIAKHADGECSREHFSYKLTPGTGHLIHTYAGDGDVLPSFAGEPVQIEISGDAQGFADKVWESLNEDNRIALYLKIVDMNDKSRSSVLYNIHADRTSPDEQHTSGTDPRTIRI